MIRDMKNRYALTEVKLKNAVKLLPLSKRDEGIIILSSFAVAKVRSNDKINSESALSP